MTSGSPRLDSATTGPVVSVIVVNYNGGERLGSCLRSLVADPYAAREIIVVENASTDGSAAVLRDAADRYPQVTALWRAENLGYAGGINLALTAARGEFIAAINMDLAVQPGWLTALVAFLTEHPETGAVSPLITLTDGQTVNAVGQDVHVTGLGFNRALGRPVGVIGSSPVRVSGIHGGAFLMRRAVMDQIGGMDAAGFLYHEDVNLSWLLQLAGFDLYCVPRSVVRHDYFLTMDPQKLYLLERNRWSMLLAYLHRRTLVLLAPVFILTELLMWAYCTLRGWRFLRAKMASYKWVAAQAAQIARRRAHAESVRRISDWKLLTRLRWRYAFGQFGTLAVQRSGSHAERGALSRAKIPH